MSRRSPKTISVVGAVLCLGLLSIGGTACGEDSTDAAAPSTTAAAVASTDAATTTTTLGPYEPVLGDIVGQALAAADVPDLAGQFSTLAGLLVRADPSIGLVHALQDDGTTKLTVFAPLNSAFPKVPAVALEAVYADSAALAQVLTYHVVAGEYHAADLTDGMELTTLQGETLKVSVKGDTISINGNKVVAADVPATNGVIFVMNDVLVPPSILKALDLG